MEPATLVTSRIVRAGHEERFRAWEGEYDAALRASPGAIRLLRLEQPNGLTHLVEDFADQAALARWRDAPRRRELTSAADAFSAEHGQEVDPRCPELRLPSEAAVPKWKTFVATWVAVFPLLLGLNAIAQALIGGLPRPVQLIATSLLLTAALTWIILPRVRRLLRPWLFADRGGGLRREPG